MIELSGVNRSFQNGEQTLNVLQNLDWKIKKGQSIALMGRSGSGKSTLLNLLGCLDRGYEGTLHVDGKDLKKMSDRELAHFRNQKIGMVFQSFHLMDQLTCKDNILLPTWFNSKEKVPASRAKELLERVGLADKINQSPNHLSGGEKQRVAIARALAMRPQILLCDEPTGNLDEETREEILALFQEIHKEDGVTLLIVTHEHRTASIADAIFQLKNGTIHPLETEDEEPSEKKSEGEDSEEKSQKQEPKEE